MNKRNLESFRGCLLGGAIGDSLGFAVEFMTIDEIKEVYGENGINNLVLGMMQNAEISDETQMTLFTAEGLLRAKGKFLRDEKDDFVTIVHNAYIRWLSTQERLPKILDKYLVNSWLLRRGWFHSLKEPEETCLEALREEKIGTIEEPINDSKYSGAVVRVAPIGLTYSKEEAFDKACMCAAITHGHPSAYLSAGVFASIISEIIHGKDIIKATTNSLKILSKHDNHEECRDIILKALELAKTDTDSIEAINELGEGWFAEEILAKAIYCAVKYNTDYKKAIITAANNSGDSDGIASITGNIVGAYLGISSIPKEYLEKIELYDTIVEVADDLLKSYENTEEWHLRYPGV